MRRGRHQQIVRVVSCILLLTAPVYAPAKAQYLTVGDPLEDYARFLQLQGILTPSSLNVRPLAADRLFGALPPDVDHPWREALSRYQPPAKKRLISAGLFDPVLATYWNSTRPFGQNDGVVWQGRGVSTAFSAGAHVRLGPLSAAVRPIVSYTQNRDFTMWPGEGYEYPLRSQIDAPQRFGPDPYTVFDWGQSYVRLGAAGLSVGISNENMWWGPAAQNPILMSNNAPGFPHLFFGTSRPVDIWMGAFQTKWFWGQLTESEFFNENPDNDRRYATAIVLDFTPRFAPGLSLGATRAFYRHMPNELTRNDYLMVLQHVLKVHTTQDLNAGNSDAYDQMLSVYARWLMPQSGFEVYGEFAKGDHSADMRDLLLQPEHSLGYTVGFQKSFVAWGDNQFRLSAEATSLQAPRAAILRRSPRTSYFYVHTGVPPGYTQAGQILGAGIGPGSTNQFLGLDWFADWGRTVVFTRRTAYDVDRFNAVALAENEQEVEWSIGGTAIYFFRGFEVSGSLSLGRLQNRHYAYNSDSSNLNVALAIRKTLWRLR